MGENPIGFDGIRWVFGSALLLVHCYLGVQEANQTNLVAFVIVLYRLHASCALASCISAAPNPELDVSGRKKRPKKSLLPSQHLEPILREEDFSSPSLSTARGVCFSKSLVVFWAWKIHSARLGSVKGAQQLLQRWDDLEAFGVEELVKLVDLAGQEDGGGKR